MESTNSLGGDKSSDTSSIRKIPPSRPPPPPPPMHSDVKASSHISEDIILPVSSDQERRDPQSRKSSFKIDEHTEKYMTGPAMRIYRGDIFVRLLQLIMIVWLMAGILFLISVSLCVFISIGYVTFKSDGKLIFVVFAFLFFAKFQLEMLNSLINTFVRLCMNIWSQKFGAGKKEFILIRWVDHVAIWISSIYTSYWGDRSTVDDFDIFEVEETFEKRVEYSKAIILGLMIFLGVGVPLITIATIYGYWAIISVFCAILTIGSALIILTVNVFARLFRCTKFLYSYFLTAGMNHILERTRAAYVATMGHDHGKNIINVLCVYSISWIIILVVCSFIFRGFRFNIILLVVCTILIILIALLRYRTKFACYRVALEKGRRRDPATPSAFASGKVSAQDVLNEFINLEWNDYYRGQNWHHVVVIFVSRFFIFLVGLMSLVYLDMKEVRSFDGSKPIELKPTDAAAQKLMLMSAGFFIVTILKDLMFFVPVRPVKLRPFLLAFFQMLQIAVSITGKIFLGGFTFTTCILISIVELNYRDARVFWPSNLRRINRSKAYNRAVRYVTIILYGVIAIFLITVLVGMFVGSAKTADVTSNELKQIFETYNANANLQLRQEVVASPICASKYTRNSLSLLDLATMSNAVYRFTKDDVLRDIHFNEHLKDWTIGQYRLDNGHYSDSSADETGVRFAEFISPMNVSVIAIRGTYKLEDVFQDMYLWSTVGLLQVSSYFGTFISAWPIDTVARLVEFINHIAAYPNLLYWDEMQNIVQSIKSGKKDDTSFQFSDINSRVAGSMVMITGHSLGGGLSSIVGAHLAIPSVTFSAPGLGYSIYNYNLTLDAIMTNTVNVIPMSDPVAKFDEQAGMVINIMCNGVGNPMKCHSIDRTVKTLAQICPSDGPRSSPSNNN